MENLIKIKLDPRRGGLAPIDFIRPCFIIYDWPGDDVDVWFSDDDGASWAKLAEDVYRVGYDQKTQRLYLSLLFDVDTISQLALFLPGGENIGVGFNITRYDLVQIAWTVEGVLGPVFPIGFPVGSELGASVGIGATIEGEFPRGVPVGFFVKYPNMRHFAVGHTVAAPVDMNIPAGFDTGTEFAASQGVGAWIMGLSEYGLVFMTLDEDTIDALSGEAVHQKQKTITLNGTDPEELD